MKVAGMFNIQSVRGHIVAALPLDVEWGNKVINKQVARRPMAQLPRLATERSDPH